MKNVSGILDILSKLSAKDKNNFKKTLQLLHKKKKVADDIIHPLHDSVFDTVNCLDCANCCKSLGPLVTDNDIKVISRFLKMKPSEFTDEFLRIDDDGDYIFKTMPCPFLDNENYCKIYEVRPKACKEYPHTDRKNFYQITNLTLKNAEICPAVYLILEKVKI